MKIVYVERGGFLLHVYAGRRPWCWGYALRARGRYLLFGGRRNG